MGDALDERREELRPLASLISKSEKARQKLAPGTWQHTMLTENLKALRIATVLLGEADGPIDEPALEDLQEASRALDSMIARVEATQMKFAPGTSQHTLQVNRLNALRIAESAVTTEMAKR